jgi:uncharacterized YigZ family protein
LRYKTLRIISTGEYRDKGSRFIATAMPVTSETDARELLDAMSARHPKANHVCYAWNIDNKEKYSDDREPANTAGLPIMQRIRKYQVYNVMVIVVRYFGGVLLGKGGLIRAYGTSAEEAILNNEIIEKEEIIHLLADVDFSIYP